MLTHHSSVAKHRGISSGRVDNVKVVCTGRIQLLLGSCAETGLQGRCLNSNRGAPISASPCLVAYTRMLRATQACSCPRCGRSEVQSCSFRRGAPWRCSVPKTSSRQGPLEKRQQDRNFVASVTRTLPGFINCREATHSPSTDRPNIGAPNIRRRYSMPRSAAATAALASHCKCCP